MVSSEYCSPKKNEDMKKILHYGVFLAFFMPWGAYATTWYVKQGASGAQSGVSWTDAFTDLQSALAAAGAGDTILVAKGTYHPSTTPTTPPSGNARDRTFLLPDGVKIFGGFAGTEAGLANRANDSLSLHVTNATVLSGDINNTPADSSDDVFHVVTLVGTSGHVLDGFTVTRGNADGNTEVSVNGVQVRRYSGGGIYNDSASGEFRNLIVANNIARSFNDELGGGAGMFNYRAGNVVVDKCVFVGNHAEHCNGGGMKNMECSPQISNSYFIGNSSNTDDEGGGGINNKTGADAVITNCVFEGNSTTNSGGGIYNDHSSPQLTNVIFRNNTAGSCGGGMDTDGNSDAILTDVLFEGNAADEDGGGLYGWQSSATLERVRFINNHAGNNGGGMYNYNTCNPILTYVTFMGNTADNNYGGFGLERDSRAELTNVLIARNTAGNNGGGIGRHGSGTTTLVLTNVTIVNNTAQNGGGGYDQGTTSQLRNSIIAGNYPNDVDVNPLLVVASRRNLVGDGADLLYIEDGSINPNGVNVSWPIFVDTANSDYRLVAGSPAIDAGDSMFYDASATPDLSGVTEDLRGARRTMGAQTDLGAYEFCSQTVTPTVTVSSSAIGGVAVMDDNVTFTAIAVNGGPNPVFEWLRNGTPAAGAPSTAVWVARAGTDFVDGDTISVRLISSEPCADPTTATSGKLGLRVVSIGVASVAASGKQLSLYPNPTKGNFTIEGIFPDNVRHTLSVADASGRILHTEVFQPNAGTAYKQISLPAGAAPGIYFLSVTAPRQPRQVVRFVVE
jgi:hypothetical protein